MINKILSLSLFAASLSPAAIVFTPTTVASGFPGDLVGWTVQVDNTFSTEWLLVSSVALTSNPAPYGLPATFLDELSSLFTFAGLAPGVSLLGASLATIEIDPLSPIGPSPFINLEVTYFLFDGDPFDPITPGNVIGDAITESLAVQLDVQAPSSPVPEPGTWALAAASLVWIARARAARG